MGSTLADLERQCDVIVAYAEGVAEAIRGALEPAMACGVLHRPGAAVAGLSGLLLASKERDDLKTFSFVCWLAYAMFNLSPVKRSWAWDALNRAGPDAFWNFALCGAWTGSHWGVPSPRNAELTERMSNLRLARVVKMVYGNGGPAGTPRTFANAIIARAERVDEALDVFRSAGLLRPAPTSEVLSPAEESFHKRLRRAAERDVQEGIFTETSEHAGNEESAQDEEPQPGRDA